jgi:hypothetical protein
MPQKKRIGPVFVIFLILGAVAYSVLRDRQRKQYEAPTREVVGFAKDVVYRSGGSITGESYVRVTLDNGEIYRLPAQFAAIGKGYQLKLHAVADGSRTIEGEVLVISTEVLQRTTPEITVR